MNNTSQFAFIISNAGDITILMDGKTYQVATDHPNYKKILDDLNCGNRESLENDLNIEKCFQTFFTTVNVTIKAGVVYYKDKAIHNALTRQIVDFFERDLPFRPLVLFMENLMQNPSARAVNELHNMREVNHMPLTESGTFLAWKRVRDDFKDFYTGKIDNTPGSVVKMARNEVCDDKDRTCESGLHFCSKEYLKHYYGGQGRIIVVEINPKDVVSIPIDYENSKGRCCEYKVLYEIDNDIDTPEGEDALPDDLYTIEEGDGVWVAKSAPKHNLRDASGRFISKDDATKGVADKPLPPLPKRDSKGRFIGRANKLGTTKVSDLVKSNHPVFNRGKHTQNKPNRDSRGRFI